VSVAGDDSDPADCCDDAGGDLGGPRAGAVDAGAEKAAAEVGGACMSASGGSTLARALG
jgi:hypothetical protein